MKPAPALPDPVAPGAETPPTCPARRQFLRPHPRPSASGLCSPGFPDCFRARAFPAYSRTWVVAPHRPLIRRVSSGSTGSTALTCRSNTCLSASELPGLGDEWRVARTAAPGRSREEGGARRSRGDRDYISQEPSLRLAEGFWALRHGLDSRWRGHHSEGREVCSRGSDGSRVDGRAWA